MLTRMPTELEQLPSYMLLRCIDMRITTSELKKALHASSGYAFPGGAEKKLGIYLLLTARMFPELSEEQYNRFLLATFKGKIPEDWPEFEEIIAIGHSQAIDLLSLNISKKGYLFARRLGVSHFDIANAAKRANFVNVEGYAKLRKTFKMSDEEIYPLIDRDINLYYYCELITKAYHKDLFEKVLEYFGRDLLAYLTIVDEFGLEPEVIVERWATTSGFNIHTYKAYRNQGMDDEAAWQKLCDTPRRRLVH